MPCSNEITGNDLPDVINDSKLYRMEYFDN